jgi:hypothetical protein
VLSGLAGNVDTACAAGGSGDSGRGITRDCRIIWKARRQCPRAFLLLFAPQFGVISDLHHKIITADPERQGGENNDSGGKGCLSACAPAGPLWALKLPPAKPLPAGADPNGHGDSKPQHHSRHDARRMAPGTVRLAAQGLQRRPNTSHRGLLGTGSENRHEDRGERPDISHPIRRDDDPQRAGFPPGIAQAHRPDDLPQ